MMVITLTPEQEAVVKDALASGVYRTEQEVIEHALNLFLEYELEEEVGFEKVRAAIEEGTAQLRRGEGLRIHDPDAFVDDVIERARKRLEARKATKAVSCQK